MSCILGSIFRGEVWKQLVLLTKRIIRRGYHFIFALLWKNAMLVLSVLNLHGLLTPASDISKDIDIAALLETNVTKTICQLLRSDFWCHPILVGQYNKTKTQFCIAQRIYYYYIRCCLIVSINQSFLHKIFYFLTSLNKLYLFF